MRTRSVVSRKRLMELLSYNPETGVFMWREKRTGVDGSMVSGCLNEAGYVVIRIDGLLYRAHRLAWLYEHGSFPEGTLDHANNDRSDNRICNLRIASNQQNSQNSRVRADNALGIKGVCWSKKYRKFVAAVTVNGTQHFCGYHLTLEAARLAVEHKRRELHGDFCNHGI